MKQLVISGQVGSTCGWHLGHHWKIHT